MRGSPLLPVAALAATLAGCSGGATVPDAPLEPLYVLVSVDGRSEPLIIAEHLYPSGTRQVYSLAFDSLRFASGSAGDRRFELRVDAFGPNGPLTPPFRAGYAFETSVARRRDRVVVEYQGGPPPLVADTFELRGGVLVRTGSFGVSCPECPAPHRVEYVYAPR